MALFLSRLQKFDIDHAVSIVAELMSNVTDDV